MPPPHGKLTSHFQAPIKLVIQLKQTWVNPLPRVVLQARLSCKLKIHLPQ